MFESFTNNFIAQHKTFWEKKNLICIWGGFNPMNLVDHGFTNVN